MSFARLLAKDIRIEARSKESLQSGLVLVGLFFILYLFVLVALEDGSLGAIAVWTPILYATAALCARGLSNEFARGTMAMLQVMPVPVAWHGWSRTIVNTALIAMLSIFTLVLGDIGFGLHVTRELWLVVALAVIGLAVIGTLTGGLAGQARAPAILTPILLIPAAAPLIQAGTRATLQALDGMLTPGPIYLMLGYDVIVIGIAWLMWPFALESD